MKLLESSLLIFITFTISLTLSSKVTSEKTLSNSFHRIHPLRKIRKQSQFRPLQIDDKIQVPIHETNIVDDVARIIENILNNKTENNQSFLERLPKILSNSSSDPSVVIGFPETSNSSNSDNLEEDCDYLEEDEFSDEECSEKESPDHHHDEGEQSQEDDSDCDEYKSSNSTDVYTTYINSTDSTFTSTSHIISSKYSQHIPFTSKSNMSTYLNTSFELGPSSAYPSPSVIIPISTQSIQPHKTTELNISSTSTMLTETITSNLHHHQTTISYRPRTGRKFLNFDNDGHLQIGNSMTIIDISVPGCQECSSMYSNSEVEISPKTTTFHLIDSISESTGYIVISEATKSMEEISTYSFSLSTLSSSLESTGTIEFLVSSTSPGLGAEIELNSTLSQGSTAEPTPYIPSLKREKFNSSHQRQTIDFDMWDETSIRASSKVIKSITKHSTKRGFSFSSAPSFNTSTQPLKFNSPLPITRTFGGVITNRNFTSQPYQFLSGTSGLIVQTILLPFLMIIALLLL
ncbi:uncharacterized protein RJT21DRAFT_128264 [Scheffersomyces amazonensis]|uniref:uncharacterized protein n=1 Tax=Scheffersomyces amazonensis TaxID=1078765 RepID=UPI00315CF2A8